MLQGEGDYLYWSECRPSEQGRCVIMRCQTLRTASGKLQNQPEDILPAPFSARSSVHEYGGGEFLVSGKELYFINANDQQIYTTSSAPSENSCQPVQITDQGNYRFTDMTLDKDRKRLVCVAEIHGTGQQQTGAAHPKNCLVEIELSSPTEKQVSVLASGHDFYASPKLSPDGKKLSWLSWSLPDMPWESAALYLGTFGADGSFDQIEQLAGDGANSVFQPEWHPDGSLYFIWDKTGWGNLYRWSGQSITDSPVHILDRPADFGQPQWVFGMKKYAILPCGRIALAFFSGGQTQTGLLNPKDKSFLEFSQKKSGITGLEQVVATRQGFAGITLSHDQPQTLTEISIPFGKTIVIRKGADCLVSPQDISSGKPFTFKNSLAEDVYGIFYPPANQKYSGTGGELPPCIFNAHGGPTAAVPQGLNLKIQYWTNRGFAWCDVDYSGSTGYGKAYRQRLDGQWGIADANDLASAATFLASTGKIDPKRCIITGSSAGGLTVLNALANSDVFAAGASYYGVTDLLKLHRTTHKFEAGYLLSLTGCTQDNYSETLPKLSPLSHADKISAPVIFFQGTKDAVVPLEQAQTMSAALKKRNIPTRLFVFEGEGHGFRKQETIISALTEEYAFYSEIFGL